MATLEDLISSIKFNPENGTRRIDRVNNSVVYVGYAAHGTATSSPAWRICRISIQGTQTVPEYAEGGAYSQIWDNRTSLFPAAGFNNSFSLVFDGVNDYVDFGNNLSKERTDAFTISMWYRPRIVTSTQTLWSKRNGASSIGLELKMLSNGRLDFTMLGATAAQTLRMQMTYSLLPTTYYHMVWTYDGTSTPAGTKLYLNTALQTLSTITNTPLASSIAVADSAKIGQFNNTQFADGHIDEVSIWSAALTQAQIDELYNSGSPADLAIHSQYATSLQAWYRMGDNDSYPAVADNKGSINGTLTNATIASIVSVVP